MRKEQVSPSSSRLKKIRSIEGKTLISGACVQVTTLFWRQTGKFCYQVRYVAVIVVVIIIVVVVVVVAH